MSQRLEDRPGMPLNLTPGSGRRPTAARPAVPVPVAERQSGVTTTIDHTRVPNWLFQFVFPRLGPAEQSCLLYILRRTYGFASAKGSSTRKQWDRIALSQFVSGNSAGSTKEGESRRYVLDLGTGLTRNSVMRALRELEDRGLVRVSYECPTLVTKSGRTKGCGWNESDDDHLSRPEIDEKTKAYKCPRCKRTLSKAYALRTLTPGFIKRFLTTTDPDGLEWGYDPAVGRFYAIEGEAPRPEAELPPSAEVREQLWFPEMVDTVVGHANTVLKSGRMKESRMIRGFYQPMIELQDSGLPREAIRYALDQVIKRRIAAQSHNRTWHGYAKACATTWLERNYGGASESKADRQAVSVEQELRRCAELNAAGDRDQARKLLHELLTNSLDQLAGEFDGDRALARRHVLESFKRGLDDYRSVRDYMVPTDYLPDWTWEQDEAAA